MGKPLRNPQHERFSRAIVFDGKPPQEAYVVAGYEPNRANHNKLLNRTDIRTRIEELTRERENAARAARMPITEMLLEIHRHGFDRVADLFERRDEVLVIRDLSMIRIEAILALLNALHDAIGMPLDRFPYDECGNH